MHYLITISNKPDMIFRLEFLVKTIKKFSNITPKFSVVINGDSFKNFDGKIDLKKIKIKNYFLDENCLIYKCNYDWTIPVPARWFLEPQDDVCVMIDADIIACKNLFEFECLDKKIVHGVAAYTNHLSLDEWKSLNFDILKIKYYFNFGVVFIPSVYLRKIGDAMIDNVFYIFDKFPKHRYFSGQIALVYSLMQLNIPVSIMNNKFNWYDLNSDLDSYNLDNIVFLHYMHNRKYVNNCFDAKKCFFNNPNEYTKIISKVANDVYSIKHI